MNETKKLKQVLKEFINKINPLYMIPCKEDYNNFISLFDDKPKQKLVVSWYWLFFTKRYNMFVFN